MTAVALPTHTPSARHLVGLPLSAASVSLCTSPCPTTTENWSLPAAKDRAHSERTPSVAGARSLVSAVLMGFGQWTRVGVETGQLGRQGFAGQL